MDNRIDMEVRVTIPHSKRYDPPATDAQIQSFRSLFGEPPDDLTFSQASAMLSCRDYAIEVVDTLRAAMGDSVRLAIGRAVAAFISRQPDVLQAVVKRSEEHTSELPSLMRISYAVFCLKNKSIQHIHTS